jgi:hypothetical protein
MALSWQWRCLSALTAIGLLALLGIARWLEPAQQGFGTHQQLGFPACTSIVLFDLNCPACGMTTSWAWLTRGEIVQSLRVNAGGCLLALIALAYLPTSCYLLCGGRVSPGGQYSWAFGLSLLGALLISIVQWAYRWGG